MSNGEDPETPGDDTTNEEAVSPTALGERLDGTAAALADAETEADLDTVEEHLDAVETDLASLDSEAEQELADRIGDLRDGIGEQRGPYAEAVTAELDSAAETITTSEWTEEGFTDVAAAVQRFVETAGETLGESFTLDTSDSESVAAGSAAVSETVETAGLHPDEDAASIATLLDAAGDLTDTLEASQVLGDLAIREQLRRLGFYDVLTPRNRTDFPPEWNAIKLYEARGEVEPILLALEKFDSEFMQDNILDALEHIAAEEAFEEVKALAERRNKQPVRILGRIGDERACEMLHEFLGARDIELEKTTLWALGCIGSEESTELVAKRLAADNPEVRSAAARSLGLLGDTRAIDPLADRLAEDDDERVRASAAWALNRIGTERALDALAAYTDDRSYLVQVEAERAAGA